jgi:polygalacturonase
MSNPLTRRDWLGLVSTASIGSASIGTVSIGTATTSTAAELADAHGAQRGAAARAPAEAQASARPQAGGTADLGSRVYNIRDYGAKGDGKTMDTAALQAAIDACNRDGGGTVLVPAGTFQIGTTEMRSNVTLHIAAGGTLLGSADGRQYHAVDAIPLRGDSTLVDGNWALIFAVDAKDFAIEGPGLIDGQGLQFHAAARGVPPPSGLGGNNRPYHILLHHCEHVRIRDLRLWQSAYHSVRVIQSKYVQMDGLHIYNRVNSNNDGFHFISCEYVTVTNCNLQTQDDACALFGSCKFVTVTNSTFSTRWSVFRFGGGVAENIAVSNCVLHQVYGCPFKFQGTPGSRFERMAFSNIILDDVTGPISISVGPSQQPAPGNQAAPGIVRDISFTNIHGTVTTDPPQLPDVPFTSQIRPGEGHSAIVLNAVGDSIVERITFDNVHLTFGGGGTAEEAANRKVPEVAGEYFMLGPIPAYGLYARNARAVTLNNVRFEVNQPDLRPALVFDHVQDAAISGLTVQGNAQAESTVRFAGTKKVFMAATRLLDRAATFLQIEGPANDSVVVDGGDFSGATQTVAFKDGATPASVRLRG